jgi:hypothetical protein
VGKASGEMGGGGGGASGHAVGRAVQLCRERVEWGMWYVMRPRRRPLWRCLVTRRSCAWLWPLQIRADRDCGKRSQRLRMDGWVGRGAEVGEDLVEEAGRRICLVDGVVEQTALGVLRLRGQTQSFGCLIVSVEVVRALPVWQAWTSGPLLALLART